MNAPVNLRVNELTGANVARNFEDLYKRLSRLNGDVDSTVLENQDQELYQQIRTINGSFIIGITGEGSTKDVISI